MLILHTWRCFNAKHAHQQEREPLRINGGEDAILFGVMMMMVYEQRDGMSEHSLINLLASIKGREPDKMSSEDQIAFRESILPQFRESTAYITQMLSMISGNSMDRYMPRVTPPENPHSTSWLWTLLIDDSEQLESFLDAPDKVQQLVTIMDGPIIFKLDLFSEAHHPGLNHPPYIQLSVCCADDSAATLFEEAMHAAAELLQPLCEKAIEYRVISREGANVWITRPKDISAEIKKTVEAVRTEAENMYPFPIPGFVESFGFEVEFDANASPDLVDKTIYILLVVFHAVAHGLRQSDGTK